VDTETGDSQPFMGTATFGDGFPMNSYKRYASLSPDGQAAFYGVYDSKVGLTTILRRSVADGSEVELGRLPPGKTGAGSALAVSRDGKYLATHADTGVWRIATAGGGTSVVWNRPEGTEGRVPAWSADGRRLFVPVISQSAGVRLCNLWSVPLDGGKARELSVGLHDIFSLSMSPDGKTLVFMDENYNNELWVMRNLFPSPRKGK
jgi:Tol biopolymer transport system component